MDENKYLDAVDISYDVTYKAKELGPQKYSDAYYQTFHDAYAIKCDDTIKDIERLDIITNSIKELGFNSLKNSFIPALSSWKIPSHFPVPIESKTFLSL